MSFQMTEPLVKKLLATVDAGLVSGLGEPEPGKMCVEAAISYALGEPHSDGPSCVDPAVRMAIIRLNDSPWSSDAARANGMRRVAIAQLGSQAIDILKFVTLLAEYTIPEVLPVALQAAAKLKPSYGALLKEAARRCEAEGTGAAAYVAAERDRMLSLCASLMVRVLQECGSPGCNWLWLVDETEGSR